MKITLGIFFSDLLPVEQNKNISELAFSSYFKSFLTLKTTSQQDDWN